MKIALFYGHYSSNIGDVAINRGLIDLLKKSFGNNFSLTVFFLNGDGEKLNGKASFGDASNVNYEAVYVDVSMAMKSIQNPESFLQALGCSSHDLILVNGGEHLFSLRDNPNWMNLFWRSLPLISANSNKIRSVVLPSTIGFFEHKDGMKYAENFLKESTDFVCRDVRSFNYLSNDLGMKNVKLLPDLAFNIKFDNESTSKDRRYDTVGIIIRPDKVGLRVGARSSKEKYVELADSDFSESLSLKFGLRAAEAILNETKSRIKIFIQTDADRSISEELYRALGGNSNSSRVELITPNSIDDYLRELSTCGCIVTSRLHAAILSCVVDTPTVTYYFQEHGHKMPGTFELLEASDRCFLLTEENLNENADNISVRIQGAKDGQDQIKQKIDELKKESVDYFKHIMSSSAGTFSKTTLAEVPEWLVGVTVETSSSEVKTAMIQKNVRVREVLDARTKRFEMMMEKNEELKKRNVALKKRNESLEKRYQVLKYPKRILRKFLSNKNYH